MIAGIAAPNFPVPTNALQPAFPSPSGIAYAGYVAKLDAAGSKLLFSTWFGGTVSGIVSQGPAALAIDSAGTVWITGGAAPSSLPVLAGTPTLGESYLAGLSNDGSTRLSLFTAPDNAAGQAVQATAAGTVAPQTNSFTSTGR